MKARNRDPGSLLGGNEKRRSRGGATSASRKRRYLRRAGRTQREPKTLNAPGFPGLWGERVSDRSALLPNTTLRTGILVQQNGYGLTGASGERAAMNLCVIPSVERGTRVGGVPTYGGWNPARPGPSLDARDDIQG